ncbi:AMP-binding protein [Nodularia harveyana UHCC-0300]|uniref:AMP-binding protein n=1 Tax=Nodularia harveyana UHCC-0300 TaxID=2974287 RepID=A0ABU5UED0_9CYAN|nr:AMP-binding protein [Nodularia harveyana]MEA5581852.1 AMP-binding protein [Nodularia harveyana UHCC-0300]
MTSNILVDHQTVVDLLQEKALQQPCKTAFTFLQDGEIEAQSLTYQGLAQEARAIATQLKTLVDRGDRALLLYPPGLEFISAFFGCLYAQVVAVPAYPPRRNQNLGRLQAIASDTQATVVLTTKSLLTNREAWSQQAPELTTIPWLATDDIDLNGDSHWQKPEISSDTLAFLQYTSGSTGKPKGVMVTHGNVLYNERMIELAYQHSQQTVIVGWLPLFHDMGLIGNILQPLYLGVSCHLMSPVAFLQKPVRWLQAISRYQATTSGGPNFAYDLCINKITPEQIAGLDLSSWELAFNGAEPVQAETLEKFATKFKPCGFRSQAFYPCYGMAETTLLVSGGMKTSDPVLLSVDSAAIEQNQVVISSEQSADSKQIVSCGKTWLEQKIAIANPETLTQCSPEQIGEIWVSGANVAAGYWQNPQATTETFQAYLADTKEGPFLRTGDLGFIRNGELFVTGRIKDLIIIRGQNHYPQDIEITTQKSHPGLRPSCGAAFSITVAGEERLVIVQELERSYLRQLDIDQVVGAIRKAVSEEHELQVYAVVLLRTASIPKTSSGKIQRQGCRTGFLAKDLQIVGEWQANLQESEHIQKTAKIPAEENSIQPVFTPEEIQNFLVKHLASSLNMSADEVDTQEPFAYYGLDSSAAVSITNELSEWLGCEVDPTLFWDYPSIAALAQYLAKQGTSPPTLETINKESGNEVIRGSSQSHE